MSLGLHLFVSILIGLVLTLLIDIDEWVENRRHITPATFFFNLAVFSVLMYVCIKYL